MRQTTVYTSGLIVMAGLTRPSLAANACKDGRVNHGWAGGERSELRTVAIITWHVTCVCIAEVVRDDRTGSLTAR